MNSEDYLEASARTVSSKFHGELVGKYVLMKALSDVRLLGKHIDLMKKALFYGKSPLGVRYPEDMAVKMPGMKDELHAVLGMITEVVEIIEVLFLNDKTVDDAKILDESGDLLWYIALLLRKRGLTFSEAMEKNIEKLRVRFPEKFSEESAVNRNDDAEQSIFLNIH